jgi:hypothetical protein
VVTALFGRIYGLRHLFGNKIGSQAHVGGHKMSEDTHVDNLSVPRPEAWTTGFLYTFIEQCWSNSIAVVGNKNVIASRLTAIDNIFEHAHQNLRPNSMAEVVPSLLALRSFNAFRASVMVCLCLPTESYPLQRACLETAGYARLIAIDRKLSEYWLNRTDDAEAKGRFTNRAVREAIASGDEGLAKIYQALYERTIDFGAHLNEKSVTINVVKESVGTGALQYLLLAGDGPGLDLALRTCAQAGICALKVLNLVFKWQFEAIDFEKRIASASVPF